MAVRNAPLTMTDQIQAKKARLDSSKSESPSCSNVLLITSLSPDVTDQEIATLAIPFGTISNMLINRKKCQAFIEMESQEAAESMHRYYTTVCPPVIRSEGQAEVRYSKYSSLTITGYNEAAASAVSAANKQFMTENQDLVDGNPHQVLHVQIEPIVPNKEIGYMPFYCTFRRFGTVLRVISFKKGNVRHAFIEFQDPLSALVGKLLMLNLPILSNEDGSPCATITRIEFSHQPSLEIHREDSNCRDFVINPLADDLLIPSMPSMSRMGDSSSLSSIKREVDQLTEDKLCSLDVGTLIGLASRLVKPLLHVASGIVGPQSDMARGHGETIHNLLSMIGEADRYAQMNRPHHAAKNSVPGQIKADTIVASICDPNSNSPVVYVSNLNAERVTPETLFLLFGVYGNVTRVKILYNRRDNALVQLADSIQAQRAAYHLNGVPLYGKKIRCVISKNTSILLPVAGHNSQEHLSGDSKMEADQSTTCDYANHRLHRFKRLNSRNINNICPPSSILHVCNLPQTITAEDLKAAFELGTGFQIQQIRILPTEKKMALIQFEDLEKSIAALITMHDYPIEENCRIKISFSKIPIAS